MIILGWLLLLVGLAVGLYWRVRFLALAYRRSAWWLVVCLAVPAASWLFLFLNWKTSIQPFVSCLGWLVLAGIGGVMVEIAL
jgi:hypothetical protein